VELQIAVNMAFGVEFSAFELTRGVSIHQLTTPLLERMGLSPIVEVNKPGQKQMTSPLSAPDRLAEIDLEKVVVPPQLFSSVAAQQLV
jgi:hypothetical protein